VAGAVAAAVLGLTLSGCQSGTAGTVAAVSSGNTTAGRGSGAAADTLPRYYAEATATHSPAYASPDDISIRNTSTGAVVATVRPPRPQATLGYVFAAGRADTWIVGAQPWHPVRVAKYGVHLDNGAQPVTLFTLTFDPATRHVTLARLPGPRVPGNDLPVAALSADGTRLAEVLLTVGKPVTHGGATLQPASAWLRVYTMNGGTVVASSHELATARDVNAVSSYTATWLDDNRTLALGGAFGPVGVNPPVNTVQYIDASAPGTLAVSKTVRLVFPAPGKPTFDSKTATPQNCFYPPLAISDGQSITCGGAAVTAMNAGGYTNLGIWVFSARTGKLTGSWGRHSIFGGQDVFTDTPQVLWASPAGRVIVATAITPANQGANLYIRTADARLHRVPWPGLIQYPGIANIIEPQVAW
jgi:hypothetical protein